MSGAGQGYGEGFFYTPEDQAAQQSIRRRQAYAQALMQGRQHQGQYGGLADAGNSIAGALIGKKADKDYSALATKSQGEYSSALANLLKGGSGPSPQVSNAPQELDPEGNPMPSQAPAQGQPQSIMERIAASGNPALMYQFGPQALQAQMQSEMTRGNKLWENELPESRAAREGRAGSLQSQETLAEHNNQLPMNAAQLAADQRAKDQNSLGYAQLNKPVSLGFGQQLVDPRSGRVVAGGGNPFGGEPIAVDQNSQSLNAQTGLSQQAINFLQTGALPRGQAGQAAVNKEVQEWSVKNGINTATMQAQAKATNHVVQQNLTRNNQAQILEHELEGTIKSVSPIVDAIGQGRVNIANLANVWAGKQVNDPNVQAARDQLLRLRSELAGYNAVAAGKLTDQGTPRVDDGDLREAEQVIGAGINSGGLQGLLNSVGMTTTKNRNILQNSLDDANQQMWGLFGVDKNYKRKGPPLNLDNPGGGNNKPPPSGTITPEAARAELARRRAAQGK